MTSNFETLALSELTRLSACTPCFFDAATNTYLHISIPDAALSGLAAVHITTEESLAEIPKDAGNYWILTNEPIRHCLHGDKACPQRLPSGLTVIYNGVSGGLRDRAKQHLLREDAKGGFGAQSGISLDLLRQAPTATSSHAKCAWAPKKKIPKVLIDGAYKKATSKAQMVTALQLSEEERAYAGTVDELYFKNGIDVRAAKHSEYQWIFAFAPIADHSIRDYVESGWRKLHGDPVLCSYSEGR